MILPQNPNGTAEFEKSQLFAPYMNPKVGDLLRYNPALDRLIIVGHNDKPEYIIDNIRKEGFLNRKIFVTIKKILIM